MTDLAARCSLVMDAKTRAQLRRNDPWEVRGAYAWVKQVKEIPELMTVSEAALMNLAPLIAEVREDRPGTLGNALRGVNEHRIRRLLASERGDDLNDQLARAIRLMHRVAPISDVIATAVFWGDNRRRRIAQDYFGQGADDAE